MRAVERLREQFSAGFGGIWKLRSQSGPRFMSEMEAIRATVGLQRERAYLDLLSSIDHSADPVGTSLTILLEQNGIRSKTVEKAMLTAGVDMFFRDETGERNKKLPQELKDFLEQVYRGRRVTVDEIRVLRHQSGIVANPSYEPYVMMEVSPELGTASPTEEERKWFISGEHETAISGVIHVTKNSGGKWKYDIYGESMGAFLSQDWLRRSRGGFKENNLEGDVSISVIRAICKLVPIPPIHLDNVCSANKNIFVQPNYDPDFNFPLPQVKYK